MKQYCDCIIWLRKHTKGYTKSIGMTSAPALRPHIQDHRLRIILTGPSRAVCGFVRDSLLGYNVGALSTDKESTCWRAKVNGREVTVVETPDILGISLCARERALETLKSLQLVSPGPHAFLLALPVTCLHQTEQKIVSDFLVKVLQLVGEEAAKYVLVVFACVDSYGTCSTFDRHYLQIKASFHTYGKRFGFVNFSPGRSMESSTTESRRMLERVAEMRAQQDHYIHEIQWREDCIRKKLLNDMTEQLAQNLVKEQEM